MPNEIVEKRFQPQTIGVRAITKLWHDDIARAIEALGGLDAAAEAFGVSKQTLLAWRAFRACPSPRLKKRWEQVDAVLLETVGKGIDELWPPKVREAVAAQVLHKPRQEVRRIDTQVIGRAAQSIEDQRHGSDPSAVAMSSELKEKVRAEVDKLNCPRRRDMLIMHFGLDGERPMMLKDIAKKYGISTGRAQELVKSAMRRLSGQHGFQQLYKDGLTCGGSSSDG